MSNLTEKWKNRELEDREYYIKSNKGDTYIDICADGNFMFTNYRSIEEVLAPVPSYAEWQKLHQYTRNCVEEIKILREQLDVKNGMVDSLIVENDRLKKLLKKVRCYLLDDYDIEDRILVCETIDEVLK